MSRPLVMKYTREDYKTYVVISDYDTMTFHGTELPDDATPDLIAKFFGEAERAATKKFEENYDGPSTSSGWIESEPEYKYTGD